ncbi:hypothetical protein [Actinomadura harenae]|uniref:CU044_5270 family protein n=1 Tax=Actinomadura harenae TaxID=2483351 RepID=A0A3M2M2R1_9ACTN|nr:hypothetical protein [Actinomadura harenae]RMI41398.1 hypothetical protein EBO15_23320 [Actinomadura harenae]
MRDLEAVAEIHVREREPSDAARATARARLMAEIGREDGGRRRERPVGRPPGKAGVLLLAGAIAACSVTALSLVTGVMRDALPYYKVEPIVYREGDAARFLFAAADGTANTPGSGRLWYRRSSVGGTAVVHSPIRPGVEYAMQVEQDDYVLASPNGPLSRKDRAQSAEWSGEQVTVRPASAGDRAKWEADGKPGADALGVEVPDRSIGPEMGNGPVLDFGVDGARRLPTDPAKLRAALLNYAVRVGHERPADPDAYLYRSASFLLVDVPVDYGVRVATYRLLASLRGVRTVTAADAAGRRYQGVALRTTTGENGTIDSELLIDPGTGRLAAGQEVVVTPGPRTASLRPGDRWRYEIVRQAGWTDRPAESLVPDPRLPPPGEPPEGGG